MSKDIKYNLDDLKLADKILSGNLKKNIAFQLRNTNNKLKVIDNRSGENKDLPIGYTIEIYNKDDTLMMQMIQGE